MRLCIGFISYIVDRGKNSSAIQNQIAETINYDEWVDLTERAKIRLQSSLLSSSPVEITTGLQAFLARN